MTLVVDGDSILVGTVPLSLSAQLDLEESLYIQQLGHDSPMFHAVSAGYAHLHSDTVSLSAQLIS